MPGPACCLLAAFISSASVVEAAAGVDGEVAAGRAPVQLNGQEENSVTFTLVPGAALRLRGPTNTLSLSYTPRIFYRVPNQLEVSRPLVLHQFQLDDVLRASRSLTWTSAAGLSIGEIDYTASALVFDPGSSAVRTSVVDIFRGEGQTGFKLDVTRRLRWSTDASAEYTTPINAGDPSTPPPVAFVGDLSNAATGTVPESAQISATSSLSYAVTRADRIAANGEVTYQWFPDTGLFLLLSPDLSWDSQLSRQTTMSVSAGVAYVITLATPDGSDPGDAIGGTGSFQMDSVLYKARSIKVSTGFGANLDWFFDPIAGTSQPRAGADAGTNIDIGRDWSISPNFSFYTILRGASTTLGEPAIVTPDGTAAPVPVTAQGITYDATQLRGEIPFTYRISNLVSLNFGTRGSLRGRSLTQDNFRLGERYEIWAFFGLTVRYGSGHERAAWLSL